MMNRKRVLGFRCWVLGCLPQHLEPNTQHLFLIHHSAFRIHHFFYCAGESKRSAPSCWNIVMKSKLFQASTILPSRTRTIVIPVNSTG